LAYVRSKASLEDFSWGLAKEIGNRGITVNNIARGPLNTSFFYPTKHLNQLNILRVRVSKVGLGEVADIVYLEVFVSPEAGWITAQTIFINGGFLTDIPALEFFSVLFLSLRLFLKR
jgi:NAD(P)-dependent dehydrogenase (short-subunit alcohol dehydrogenase family)